MKKLFTAEYRKFQIALAAVVPVAVKAFADGSISSEEIGLIVVTVAVAFGVKQAENR